VQRLARVIHQAINKCFAFHLSRPSFTHWRLTLFARASVVFPPQPGDTCRNQKRRSTTRQCVISGRLREQISGAGAAAEKPAQREIAAGEPDDRRTGSDDLDCLFSCRPGCQFLLGVLPPSEATNLAEYSDRACYRRRAGRARSRGLAWYFWMVRRLSGPRG